MPPNVLLADHAYMAPSEGPTFRIGKNPPSLTIEINERVIIGINKDPDNLSAVNREIKSQLKRFWAENVSWIGGIYDGS